MNTQQAYNKWSESYDDVVNKTRDVEAIAIRSVLEEFNFLNLLEWGCGTGKNTTWLIEKAEQMTAADFSDEMMNKAKEKLKSERILFVQADITKPWNFGNEQYDTITCSLILEHIENLNFVFAEAGKALKSGGLFYVGELHPFKQYTGSKARFETGEGTFKLESFTHHVSDYYKAAALNGFSCLKIDEWFDDNERAGIPRLLSFLFQKKEFAQ